MDLQALFNQLPSGQKDAQRIAMFAAAVAARAAELIQDPRLTEFNTEAYGLIFKWGNTAAELPKKVSLSWLFKKPDPFKDLREETRKFGKRWGLDPVFMELMG